MERGPKVSVIVPTFNRKDYLGEALDSVLTQTFRNFELVVVDDGSTDGTAEFLKSRYANRIRYLHKTNGGCASARNAGIRAARGEYLAFLDSDDKFLPDKLASQVEVLDQDPNIGFVYSDAYAFSSRRRYRVRSAKPDGDGSLTYPLFVTTLLSNGSFLVRRTCIDKAGYYDETLRYNEDTDQFLRLSAVCKVRYLSKPTFAFRVHPGRKSANSLALLDALYRSSAKFLAENPEFRKRIGASADRRLGEIRLDLALEHARQRDLAACQKELNESRALHPSLRKDVYALLLRRQHLGVGAVRAGIALVEGLRRSIVYRSHQSWC